MPDYRKAQIGVEDINFDSARNNASFNRLTSTGGSQEVTKINASHIPVPSSLSWDNAESVYDFLVKAKALKTAYDAFVGNVGHWDKFLGFFDTAAELEAEHSAPDDDNFAWVNETKSFWHWDEALGTPAWADSHRKLQDETAPTLGATLSTNDNDIDFNNASGGITNLKKLTLTAQATKVISGGAIAVDQVLVKVDTEAAAATDDLVTITVPTGVNLFFIELEDAARVVTLKHGTGSNKISLPNDTDLEMSTGIIYGFVFNGTQSKYIGHYIPAVDGFIETIIDSGVSHTVTSADIGKKFILQDGIGGDFTFNIDTSVATSGEICFRNDTTGSPAYKLKGNITSGTANGKNFFRIFKGEEITFEYTPSGDLRRIAGTTTEKVLVAIDEKAQGTDGGAISTANTWLQRDLNDIESDPHGLSVSQTGNNQRVETGVYDVIAQHSFRGGNSIGSKAAVSINSVRHIWNSGYSSQTSGVHYNCNQIVKDVEILDSYDSKSEIYATSSNTNTYARGYATNASGIPELYLKMTFIRKPD